MSVAADCDLWIHAIDRPSQGGDAQTLSAVGSAGRVASSAPSQLPRSSAGDPQRKMNSGANIRHAPPGSAGVPVNITGRDEEAPHRQRKSCYRLNMLTHWIRNQHCAYFHNKHQVFKSFIDWWREQSTQLCVCTRNIHNNRHATHPTKKQCI